MFTKPSQILCAACWIFVFASSWFMFVGVVQADAKAWFLWGFFVLMGIWSGAVASGKAKATP